MKTVGHRKERELSFSASGFLLKECGKISDEMAKARPYLCIKPGVYRFKTHEEANLNQLDYEAKTMAYVTQKFQVKDENNEQRILSPSND